MPPRKVSKRDLAWYLAKEISIVHRHFRGYLEYKLIKKHKINATQFKVLLILHQKDGVNQEYICDEMLLDKSAVTRIVRKLEAEGYIRRKKNEKDKRAYELYLTEKGRNFYPEMEIILEDWNAILEDCMTEKEIDTMVNLLTNLSKKLQEKKKESLGENSK